MVDETERLVLQMSANLRGFENEMRRMRTVTDRRLKEVEDRARQADRNLDRIMGGAGRRLTDSFRDGLRGLAPTLAAAFSAQQVIAYADGWNRASNQLASVGVESGRLTARQNELADAANRTYTGFDATVGLYSRLTRATERLGYEHERVLRLTELVNMSFQASGASGTEAAAGVLQLSQALSSGLLQGDELRSLRENAPLLAQAIADAMGVSIGELKKLGAEGRITAQVVSEAILAAGDSIEARFQSMTPTVQQSLTVLNTEIGRFISTTDEGLSATDRMAQAIILLADNLDVVVTAGGIAVVMVGTRMTGAFTIATIESLRYQATLLTMAAAQTGVSRTALLASASMATLRTAMMFLLTNPIGIAITAVAGALAVLAIRSQEATRASEEMRARVSDSAAALDEQAEATARARAETGQLTPAQLDGATAAASLTGETNLLRDAHLRAAAAAKAQRLEEALLAEEVARNDYITAQRDVNRARTRARQQVAGPVTDGMSREGPPPGLDVNGVAEGRISQEARDTLADAERVYREAFRRRRGIEGQSIRDFVTPSTVRTDSTSGGGRGGGGGPSADELAARLEMIRLEQDLEIARAANNEREVARIQEQIDLIRTTNELREAGVDDAEFEAQAFLAARNLARDAAEQETRLAEQRRENEELRRDAQERATRWGERQLQVQMDLARATGDEAMLARLEREADLRRRMAEYMERYGLAGAGMAMAEQIQFDQALAEGDRQDAARSMARGFVDILRADNIWEAAGQRFQDAAWNGVEQLIAMALQNFLGQMSNGGGGIVGGLLSILGGAFGGKREFGGPVSAGKAYVVGEKRPELFVPGATGMIVPSIPKAVAAQGGRVEVVHRVVVVPDEESFITLADARAGQAAAGAYQAASADIPRRMRKTARRMKR